MASRVAALLLLGVLCLHLAADTTAEILVDCCLKTSEKRFHPKIVLDYKIQEAGKGCEINATVIISKAGKLCYVHPEGKPWMRNILNTVDRRRQK